MFRFIYLLSLFVLSGCAGSDWNSPQRSVPEVYGKGSTIGGGYTALCLYPNGKWSKRFATCTDSKRIGHGYFEQTQNTIVLKSGSEIVESLHLYPQNGDIYLIESESFERLKKGTAKFNPGTAFKKEERQNNLKK